MAQGTVKRLVQDRGFGFIVGADGVERFFHRSGMATGHWFDTLKEGEAVTFIDQPALAGKGPRACEVQKA